MGYMENTQDQTFIDNRFLDLATVYVDPSIRVSLYFTQGFGWYENSRTVLSFSPESEHSLILKSHHSQLVKVSFSLCSSCARMQTVFVQEIPFELKSKVTDVSFYMVVIHGNNPISISTLKSLESKDHQIFCSDFKVECLSQIPGVV